MIANGNGYKKITCGDKTYKWRVGKDDDSKWVPVSDFSTSHSVFDNPQFLFILADDFSLVITVPLYVPKPYAISKGNVFQGNATGGRTERYILPPELSKRLSFGATARTVEAIIEWAERGNNAVKAAFGGDIRF